MKLSFSRSSILTVLLVAALLTALPGAILRIMQTHDPYLFTKHFFEDLLARLSGPGRIRFIVQPVVAVLLGLRDGTHDARTGSPRFLAALISKGDHRPALLRHAFQSLRDLAAIAILLDLLSQALIFHEIHPGAALLVGPILIGIPYLLARTLANRTTPKRS